MVQSNLLTSTDFAIPNPQFATDFPAHSDTVYSDTLLTVTLLAVPLFVKYVTVSRYLLTLTLLVGPEVVAVSGEICI